MTETKPYNPWPLVSQVAGAVSAAGGLLLLAGLPVTLLVVGLVTVALSVFAEWRAA